MARCARFAVVVWLALAVFVTIPANAAGRNDLVSTHCREIEVPIDTDHSSARLAGCGDDSAPNLLWHLDRLDQPNGEVDGQLHGTFDRSHRGAGAVVYVMDTGIRADHVEFAGDGGSRVIAGFDVARSVPIGGSNCRSANKATNPCYADMTELPAAAHGTGVASLVAGQTVGVAPEAKIVSIRVMNEHGLATTRTYADGLDTIIAHAWSNSAPPFQTAIVNISGWVLERVIPASADPIPVVTYAAVERRMRDMIYGVDARGRRDRNGKKFLFVVAGNNLDGGCGRSGYVDRFPAILGEEIDGIVTVGGMTVDNEWWPGACRGSVEVLAPAQSIFAATITGADHYRGRKPNQRSGTSFAAPLIAGIAARLIADRPSMTPEQLESAITATSSRLRHPGADFAEGKVATLQDRDQLIATSTISGSALGMPWRMLESER
ncbi:MAG TPA: S8 family serine peptidase [Thermoanaerobaculia bacterium]|nr:S8 family serine peptidase [Thermoanaerobaculia bacterium]